MTTFTDILDFFSDIPDLLWSVLGHPQYGTIFAICGIIFSYYYFWVPWQERSIREQLNNVDDRKNWINRLGHSSTRTFYRKSIVWFLKHADDFFGLTFKSTFSKCFQIAMVYPIVLLLLSWALGGDGTLGTLRVLDPDLEIMVRYGYIAILTAFMLLIAFIMKRFSRIVTSLAEAIWKALSLVINIDVVKGKKFVLFMSGAFAAASMGALIGAFSAGLAVAFGVSGGFVGAIVGASSVDAAEALISAVLGAVVGAVAGSVVGIIFILTNFSVAIAIVAIGVLIVSLASIDLNQEQLIASIAAFFFLSAMPFINALLDTVSWQITRCLMRRSSNIHSGPKGLFIIFGAYSIDLVTAVICLIVLAAVIPSAIELMNLAFNYMDAPSINWRAMIEVARQHPLTCGLLVTGMLLTTLVPTMFHSATALVGYFLVWKPEYQRATKILSKWEHIDQPSEKQYAVKVIILQKELFIVSLFFVSFPVGMLIWVPFYLFSVGLIDFLVCVVEWSGSFWL